MENLLLGGLMEGRESTIWSEGSGFHEDLSGSDFSALGLKPFAEIQLLLAACADCQCQKSIPQKLSKLSLLFP